MKNKIINNPLIIKLGMVIFSILFIMPSITYFIKNHTVLNFEDEFMFLLKKGNEYTQTFIYLLVVIPIVFFYYLIIKKRTKIFKNMKEIFLYIILISSIYVFSVPYTCSDVFYYMGIGRIFCSYQQNPYYETIKHYVDENNVNLENDTVLKKGYNNFWADATVVYGSFWTLICGAVAFLSFGNLDFGLLLFKILNLMIHIFNCYLIYKISKKKVFVLLYGINPFVLFEGIVEVHNDMFVVNFILLSIYYFTKKKNLIFALLFLALATAIKYFAILLMPMFILYKVRKESLDIKILKSIIYGVVFLIFLFIPYLIFVRDFNVFLGIITQQEKLVKSIFLLIAMSIEQKEGIAVEFNQILLVGFFIVYLINCIEWLLRKDWKLNQAFQTEYKYVMFFLFMLITSFQPWYLMWLVPFMFFQKSDDIKLINQIQILTVFTNCIFLMYSEYWKNGVLFVFCNFVGILLLKIYNQNKRIKDLKKRI